MTFSQKYDTIKSQKGKVNNMLHSYEIRRLERNGDITIIRQLTAEPSFAKKEFKRYAEENPGIYSLYQIHRVANYYTVKEI